MHVDGSPATCANLALHSLVPDVDFVVSGPNIGHNVGRYAASAQLDRQFLTNLSCIKWISGRDQQGQSLKSLSYKHSY